MRLENAHKCLHSVKLIITNLYRHFIVVIFIFKLIVDYK